MNRSTLLALFSLFAFASATFLPCTFDEIAHGSIDGRCNNLLFPSWGTVDSFYKTGPEGTEQYPWQDVPQVSPLPTYANASLLPPPGPRPRARIVSNAMGVRANPLEDDPINHALFATSFGQFINHDLEDNRENNASFSIFPLVTYMDDPTDPLCQGTAFPPSSFRCGPSNTMLTIVARSSGGVYDAQGNVKVYNNATSYFDLSTVYASHQSDHVKLRTFTGGKLLMAAFNSITVTVSGTPRTFTFEDLLPMYNQTYLDVNPPLLVLPPNYIFTSGDGRVNENIGLALMHLIFAREHNLICDELIAAYPLWAANPVLFDQVIFRKARALNIAKYQRIIYEQYIPAEFSDYFDQRVGPYIAYNPFVDATTSTVFATAAFRYGHYSIKGWNPVDECGNTTLYNLPTNNFIASLGQTAPAPASFHPLAVLAASGSFANVARGLIARRTSTVTTAVDDGIRNIRIPSGGVDLISLDIQRARQNQVPNYQRVRKAYHGADANTNRIYGMPGCSRSLETNDAVDDPLACFLVITPDVAVATQLKNLYKKVNNIDVIIGLVAEKQVPNTSFGKTMGNIIADEYKRKRDGDRFFYKNLFRSGYFNFQERQTIQQTTMGTILQRVFGDEFPANPFISPENYRQNLANTCNN